MKNMKNDNKGMVLLEFILYFPIVVVAFFGFIISSLMITQRVVLDRAVAVTTASAANWMSTSLHRIGQPDPFKETSSPVTIRTNPYRGIIDHFYPSSRNVIEERIKELVVNGANLGITGGLAGNVEVTIDYRNYFLAGDLIVTASQKVSFPINLSLIGINATYIRLESSSSARVFRPLSNINDIHFLFDFVRYISRGNLDINTASAFIGGLPNKLDDWFKSLTEGFGDAGESEGEG